MSMAIIGVATAAVGIGLSAYEYASAPGAPKPADVAGASRAGVEAEAATLADRRRMEAAAQQGTSTTYQTAARTEKQQVGYVTIPGKPVGTSGSHTAPTTVKYVAADWQPGGKYYQEGQAAPKITYKTQKVKIPAGTATADFTGFGAAEVQGDVAKKNAQNIYDLQQKYGPQFIEEALKEEALADPQGTAARQREYDLIKEEENAKPDRPVASMLDAQVADQLKAGKGLDSVSDSVLRDAVAKAQSARGQAPGAEGQPDFSEPLTTGFQGEQRLSAAEQKALGWLTSGATPEDVDYRRKQQTLADLSSFINNRTPESQFASLSGAQKGPAPYNQGTPLASQNPNAGSSAASAALSGWNTQLTSAENTANPWMAGLSAALKGASAINTANPGH